MDPNGPNGQMGPRPSQFEGNRNRASVATKEKDWPAQFPGAPYEVWMAWNFMEFEPPGLVIS